MPESADRHGHTSTEDEAFITGARLLGETLKGHPFALGFLAIFAAAAIFLLGVRVGEIAYLAFDGEGMMVAVFGATFVTALVVIIVIGVLLDRRAAHPRCGHRVPHRPATRPTPGIRPAPFAAGPLVPTGRGRRVHRTGRPRVLLLDTPWDSLWVLAVLIANRSHAGSAPRGMY